MSVYINPIANGIAVSLLLLYFALIPVPIYQYRKYNAIRVRGNIVLASFVVYMITAFFMTLLPLPSIEAVKNMEPTRANYRPFLFVTTFLNNSGFVWNEMSTWLGAIASSSFYTVAFNVVLTIPFGVYLRKYFHQKLHGVIFWGFLLSLFYEATQFTGVWGIYPHAFRFADVDDLVVNTAGAVLGYFAGGLLDKLLPDPAKDKILHVEHAGLPRRLLALFMDSIIVNVLFEILRVTVLLLTGSKQNLIDMALYAVSSSAVFVLLPFVSKKKQTLGMSMLKLSFEDKNGELPRISGMLLHSVWIGLWLNLVPGLMGMVQSNGIIMVLQMFMLVPLIVIIFASVKNKRITYFWENCFDIYIKVDVLRK